MEQTLSQIVFETVRVHAPNCALPEQAAEIVVFGSYAAGVFTNESDIDILCVGNGTRVKSRFLDLQWIGQAEVRSDTWLGSELACHIAHYGVWLRGCGSWRSRVFSGSQAIQRKQKRAISLARTATQLWDRLHPIFREQYDVTIRRELQRLAILRAGLPVPPTKLLDDEWREGKNCSVFDVRDSLQELKAYQERSKGPKILTSFA